MTIVRYLYKIERIDLFEEINNIKYYYSFIVSSIDLETAKNYHPLGGKINWKDISYSKHECWPEFLTFIKAELIGVTDKPEGEIIMRSTEKD